MQDVSTHIKRKARDLGFSACGITRARYLSEHLPYFQSWLRNRYHASMHYMERNEAIRLDASLLMEGATSIISLAHNYYSSHEPTIDGFRVARYAHGKDYHEVLKKKMHVLLDFIKTFDDRVKGRVFTDSAPLLERAIAVEAGIGWIGKNSMLVIPGAGSYFFLSEIILTMELEYDVPFSKNHCGTCTRCIDSCPTGAIVKPRVVDSSRCISYVTIEQNIERLDSSVLESSPYIFGCDVCQDVCPWNKFAIPHEEPAFTPLDMSGIGFDAEDAERRFMQGFKHSPLSRSGYEKLKAMHAILKTRHRG